MIRATATDGTGGRVVLLGLDDDNIARLRTDHPVVVQLADFGLPPAVVTVFHDDAAGNALAAMLGKVGQVTRAEGPATAAADVVERMGGPALKASDGAAERAWQEFGEGIGASERECFMAGWAAALEGPS